MRLTEIQIAHVKALETAEGRLLPSAVLEDAKRPESPLHELIDWDAKTAAEKHWLDCAREIIRTVNLVITTETTTVRSPFYVRDPDAKGEGYRSIHALQREPESARQSLADELTRAAGVITRARDIAVALGLSDELDEMLQRIVGLQQRIGVPIGEGLSSDPASIS